MQPPGPAPIRSPRPVDQRLRAAAVWSLGHAARLLPFFVLATVVGVTWQALREIHPTAVRYALHAANPAGVQLALSITALNVAVMGLYDVIAFRQTRSRWTERWRYGAVAFAWSNFLTLGPLAGPAIRFWLYRPAVDRASDLEGGVVSIAIAFAAGLAGWTVATLAAPVFGARALVALPILALALTTSGVALARLVARRVERLAASGNSPKSSIALATVGWLDWLLAAAAFSSALSAVAPASAPSLETLRTFFLGQAIGVISLVPGGFGSSDAFWIAHLPISRNVATAALVVYRSVYYVLPWAAASFLLLSWATSRSERRTAVARRIVAGLVAGGGVLLILSTASPSVGARLLVLERVVPLPIVEIGHATAALEGILLLVVARGLAKGYRAAFQVAMLLLTLAVMSAMLKGMDWEEAVLLAGIAVAAWSQAALFDRPSQGDWLERSDLMVASVALLLLVAVGVLAHRITAETFSRFMDVGYRLESVRFLRSAVSMVVALSAAALYAALRVPDPFSRLPDSEIDRTLRLHAAIGEGTTPLMVANGDKAVFFDDDRGFCLYRTIGPYLTVFSDPVVRSAPERPAFLDALFRYAADLDRRPLFYQISVDWIPPLHDRGYVFFKLGEEAHLPLDRVTFDGHAGKMYRQILRRAERDSVTFRVVPPACVGSLMPQLAAISADWLGTRRIRERQFSVGFFDEPYLTRFPCAIVEERADSDRAPTGRILAFANLLSGPRGRELSVDLMRHRSDGPKVMDFLLVSVFLYGKERGYQHFNLGMAPLATVGAQRGAHVRERLAGLFFQRGEQWYNFQGVRAYKDKFEPDWIPRYLAYQDAWEWPMALANASALIAGGWRGIARRSVA